ncbi:hypothetical protein C0989_003643 [Termitomyces sp. Mn162]|nr:hypothetical protein C0989_003643 [Termitomyces sp. Mn162]
MLPRVAITPKGKGKGKTREEDKEKEFVEPIQDTFTVKKLRNREHVTIAGQKMIQRSAGTLLVLSPIIAAIAPGRGAPTVTVASDEKEEVENVERGESTPVVTVAEVKKATSGGEVEGEQEVEKEKVMEVEKDEESNEEVGI